MEKLYFGVPVRAPTKSEQAFFKKNPTVTGYAAEDDRIVINPYSSLKSEEKEWVARNEAIRIYLRNNPEFINSFNLTPDQAAKFAKYSPRQADVKGTVIARLMTGDPSSPPAAEGQWPQLERLGQDLARYSSLLNRNAGANDAAAQAKGAQLVGRAQAQNELLTNIYNQFPVLGKYDFAVLDSRGKQAPWQMEFYPPNERSNPVPGRPVVEVFNPQLQGAQLQSLVTGDMLHYLPQVDKGYSALRDEFRASLTPKQQAVDKKAYEMDQQSYGENRPYDQWHNVSRLDAYIRAGMFPDVNPDWQGALTPSQMEIIGRMTKYLQTPTTEE